jgi:hypothetical protein
MGDGSCAPLAAALAGDVLRTAAYTFLAAALAGDVLRTAAYRWIPHNAGFGFLDRPPATLGKIHF